MLYKTIVLELIRQEPELHRRLTASKRLLSTMEALAQELRTDHERLMNELIQKGKDPTLASQEAREIAVAEMEQHLRSVAQAPEPVPLGEAMEYMKNHTKNA